jgi:hypothetical protein
VTKKVVCEHQIHGLVMVTVAAPDTELIADKMEQECLISTWFSKYNPSVTQGI